MSKVNLMGLTLRLDLRGSALVSTHLFNVFNLLEPKEKNFQKVRSTSSLASLA